MKCITERMQSVENMTGNAGASGDDTADPMALLQEHHTRTIRASEHLLIRSQTAGAPELPTASQVPLEQSMRTAFNADRQKFCSAFNESLVAIGEAENQHQTVDRRHVQHTADSWLALLSLCEDQRRIAIGKLHDFGGVHVSDAVEQPSSTATISLAFDDLSSAVLCASTDTAEQCAHQLQTGEVLPDTHCIRTLQVLNNYVERTHPPVPSVPNARPIAETIRQRPNCDMQLDTYLANIVRAVQTETQSQAQHVRTNVTAIWGDRVKFGARGDVSMYARCGHAGSVEPVPVRPLLDPTDYAFAIDADDRAVTVCESNDEEPAAMAIADIIRDYQDIWHIVADVCQPDFDRNTILSSLEMDRMSLQSIIDTSDSLTIFFWAYEAEIHRFVSFIFSAIRRRQVAAKMQAWQLCTRC